ncbi:hypothetical protein [Acidomonas methanolica]|uniref:Uncharacterized protein n=1 Tax=Acidomonas methanolica NBRC 104435 TaxID=1231351 RepID=A0A023D3K8_ACIMT|nr:hypothetical protein [Acidomonas methanolica]MBU2655787.1 hypothetical protein [Acidomonas methanolica]TCS19059.1 hypothetical protein EDC31_1605 [Acidomonas methanolica]GAJ28406.1 hypothetical protein Amme_022_004 [Acidomonas methanolica NBRC 104435]GBQ49819.1 hypothetical protein AA0498_1076 [Acidomonas methanolica]GEL00721.1 hypothetical protein AME01nite_32190 [Acidomonas methanolica NBRC 104435]
MAEIETFPPRPGSDPRLEDLHAGLHEVMRLVELEHQILRQRLDGLLADSDGAKLLEGVVALSGCISHKLTGLLQTCREIGNL